MLNQPTDTSPQELDRYQKLINAVEILADDPAVVEGPVPFNDQGIRAFAASVESERLLDHLSDHDSTTVGMLLGLDFFGGPERIARRIVDWLGEKNSVGIVDDNTWAVVSALAAALKIMTDAFAGIPPNEEAGQ